VSYVSPLHKKSICAALVSLFSEEGEQVHCMLGVLNRCWPASHNSSAVGSGRRFWDGFRESHIGSFVRELRMRQKERPGCLTLPGPSFRDLPALDAEQADPR